MSALDLGTTLSAYGYAGTLILMAVQGALVWASAYAFTRGRHRSRFLVKLMAIAAAWFAWVLVGAAIASVLGFLGIALVLSVLPSGIYGSLISLGIWTVWDSELDASREAEGA